MPDSDVLLLTCPRCHARVQAKTEASTQRLFYTDKPANITSGIKVTLNRCPSCHLVMTATQKLEDYKKMKGVEAPRIKWGDPLRVWPGDQIQLSTIIPPAIRDSLGEAAKCLEHGAFTASVAMTGRALEAIARHFHKNGNETRLMLGRGLEELHNNKIIDDRLYLWSKELHEHRNLAAHATGTSFERTDAEDLFDFAVAICEYVFVVSEKYDNFVKRKQEKATEIDVSTL